MQDPEKDIDIVALPAENLLLDSYRIRRKGFLGLSNLNSCRPYQYQLDPSAQHSEVSRPAESEMSEKVLIEETLLHNKTPQATLVQLGRAGYTVNVLELRAEMMERTNIEKEMLMKRGPPPAVIFQNSENNIDNANDQLNNATANGEDAISQNSHQAEDHEDSRESDAENSAYDEYADDYNNGQSFVDEESNELEEREESSGNDEDWETIASDDSIGYPGEW
jgi:hypothetical protein